ncbi:MAG: YncE family protein [Nitrososphaerota archaeon]|nr:YncE family protein [Nitrososphaerota archaeon]
MLRPTARIPLPSHSEGEYDHADIHLQSGKVYIAHTTNNSVEVVDGEKMVHVTTIPGCPETSGVLCAQSEGLVFAASRGEGKVLVIDVGTDKTKMEIPVGPRPNGLAWDAKRKHLLVADVEDNKARLLDPTSGEMLSSLNLRGRPRWCLHVRELDLFLVNIRDPPGISLISPDTMGEKKFVPISVAGPHGLEVSDSERAFVACDGRELVVLDIRGEREIAHIPLSGGPDVLWLNRAKGRLYCAIGEPGVIDVIDTAKLTVSEKVPTEEGAHTLTFDGKRQRLYSFLPSTNCVAVYSEE